MNFVLTKSLNERRKLDDTNESLKVTRVLRDMSLDFCFTEAFDTADCSFLIVACRDE